MGKAVLRTVGTLAIAVGAIVLAAPTGGLSIGLAGALGVSATVASAIIAVGVTVLGTLALNTLVPPPSAHGAQGALQTFRQSIANSYIIYGKRRVGGLLVFYHPKGKDFRYYVIAHAGHHCHGILQWYLNDEAVMVDGSGKVTSGAYAEHAWLWFEPGDANAAANSTFVAECDGKWTSAHRGRGVAKTFAKFEMVDAIVQAGMPQITAVIEGKDDIVDPRTGTAGYTRLATPITYDWFRTPREEGGFGAQADEVPSDDVLAAWTEICAESVTVPGGTEVRYELDCWITTGGAPSDLRTTFTLCQAGTYTYAEGKFLLRPGYWVGVSHHLSERDVAGPLVIPALGDPQGIVTVASGTFVDPANNYQPMPIPARSVAGVDVVEGGFDLPHISSSTRGQRILEIMLRRAQCEKRVTWPMNIAGLVVSAIDTVALDTARYGLGNYAWVVDGWGLSQDFGVSLQLREENEDIYSDDIAYASASAPPSLAAADPITDGAVAALQVTVTTQGTTIDGQATELTDHSDKLTELKARLDAAGIPDV